MSRSPRTSIKGVALIRVSTAGQAHESKAGIPAQREAIRRLCEAHGIEIAPEHHFELTDISGASVRSSPEYQEFLQALTRPEITAVVTKEFSRLMRPESFDDFAILQRLVEAGITLHLPDAVMNMANRQDWFMAGIKASIAGMERLDIRQRMMDGKEALRRSGRHPSSSASLPRGLRYDKRAGWSYDEDRLAAVRMLFQLFLGGETNYQRLSQLTGIGRSSVPTTLTNPAYAGVLTYRMKYDSRPGEHYNAKTGKRLKRRSIERKDAERIEIRLPMEPVISMEQHRAIVQVVERYRAPLARARTIASPRFTYRGYLRCSCCGDRVYSWNAGQLQSGAFKDYYFCKTVSPRERAKQAEPCLNNRYMARQVLEDSIDELITAKLTEEKFLTAVVGSHMAEVSAGADTRTLELRLSKLMAKRERVHELFIDGAIDSGERRTRSAGLDAGIRAVKLEMQRARGIVFDPSQIIDIVRVFREWKFLERSAKRRILDSVLPEVFVDRYAVTGVTLRIGSDKNPYSQTPGIVTYIGSDNAGHSQTPGVVTTDASLSSIDVYIPFQSSELQPELAGAPK